MDSNVEKSQRRVNTERNGTGEASQTDRALGGPQEWSQQEWQPMGSKEK